MPIIPANVFVVVKLNCGITIKVKYPKMRQKIDVAPPKKRNLIALDLKANNDSLKIDFWKVRNIR